VHRLCAGTGWAPERAVGSSVWTVFDGHGEVELDGRTYVVGRGDVLAVPSWCPISVRTVDGLDLFVFSDAPVYEALGLGRP
jgi:gentisate 1,2-dioxygenase